MNNNAYEKENTLFDSCEIDIDKVHEEINLFHDRIKNIDKIAVKAEYKGVVK